MCLHFLPGYISCIFDHVSINRMIIIWGRSPVVYTCTYNKIHKLYNTKYTKLTIKTCMRASISVCFRFNRKKNPKVKVIHWTHFILVQTCIQKGVFFKKKISFIFIRKYLFYNNWSSFFWRLIARNRSRHDEWEFPLCQI